MDFYLYSEEIIEKMRNITIIFRTTNSCNLDCKYCYDKENHRQKDMENKYFKAKIPSIINNIKYLWKDKKAKCEIIFHGGEPLVINPENYEELISEIKKEYPKAIISIQTNGTLINEKFIKLFKKYNIHLGISLDGYNEITNKNRVFCNGNNSFNIVIKNIEMLKNNNVKFGIIMTLTSEVLGKEKELYEFISKNKLKCNIRPAFKSNDLNVDYMTDEQYFEFFKILFMIWINDQEKKVKITQIRELYDEFAKVLEPTYNNKSCSNSGKCFYDFISLDCEGNLYSCNRTYNNKDFYYGKISELSEEELKKKMAQRICERKILINNSQCKDCELFDECHGGCPANGYILSNNNMGIDKSFCIAKRKIRHFVKKYLQENNLKTQYIEMRKNEK